MKAIFIISGEKKTGKTQFLKNLISALSDTEYKLKEFYSQHYEANDSYHINNIQTHEKISLLNKKGLPAEKPGHFQISKSGIQTGTAWLTSVENSNNDILVLDEIGYYELNGMVWYELFSDAVNLPNPLIFTTKTRHLWKIITKWRIHPAAVYYPPEFLYPEKVFKQIFRIIKLYEKDSF